MSKSIPEAIPAAVKPRKAEKALMASPSPRKKPDIILSLLRRTKGAAIEQLQEATGWQPHSIRAAISIFRKKGVNISRIQAKDGTTLYRAEKA